MSAGTLTVHQLLSVLTDLDALALQDTTDTSTIYVDDLVSPAVRIVFEHDPAAPGIATSFVVEGADGAPLYAAGDYGVPLATFEALVAAQDVEAALALLLVDLGTLALAEDAGASLISLKDGLVIEGNDENTLFEVAHEATTVNAGDGDDVIVLRTTGDGGYFDGGEGNDTLWLDTSLGAAQVLLVDGSLMVERGFGEPPYFQWFESIEFFRGSVGRERFDGVGIGTRFEGGAGDDQFFLWNDSPTLVDIATYADEGGDNGIVVNFGFDPFNLSDMEEGLEAALMAVLAGADAPGNGFVRDTFGGLDNMSTGFLIEGSKWDDFFYGSGVEDGFVGGSGADHFFGGDGDDEFDGGADQDTFYLSGSFNDYVVTYDAGADVFTIAADDASGTDTVTGVEAFSFGGDVRTAAELKPVVVDSPPVATNDDNDSDAVIEAAGNDAGDTSALGDLIENDLDADGDTISVIGIRIVGDGDAGSFLPVGATREIAGKYGTLTIAQDGTWGYVLDNDRTATNALPAGTTAYDVFTYQISAGGETDEATLTIAIGGRNDAPAAGADSLSTNEDQPLTIDASLLTANDTDPEGDAIAVTAVQGATNGTVALAAGKVTFTPTPGFHGTAGFSYSVHDALGAVVTQQVSVVVGSVNDTPQANSDTGLATKEDQPLTIIAATLLANDSDPDGDALTIASVSGGVGGTVVLNANGTITFTPIADFNGQARFTYRVKDGAGALSASATATITVAPVNDAPSFTGVGPLAATVLENTTFVASLSALDIDSAALTFGLGGADSDAFAIVGNTLRFAAPVDFEAPTDSDGNGVYQVSVTVSDGALSETRNIAVFVLDGTGNKIAGTNAADRVDAGNGVGGKTATGEEDVVDGKGGRDTLAGAAGDDVLLGGKGDDRLNGDAGDDVLRGGAGRDRLDGGAGIDTADFSDAGKAVVLTLNGAHQARARIGGAADDMLKNMENATGGKRGDQLTGDKAANVLMGNGGSDILAGELGADTLGGGAGRDRFVFDTKLKASNVDTILDFTHNADRIALDAGVFKAIGPSLSSNEFRAGAGIVAALDRNDRVVYDTLTGALYYDRDGNKPGGAAAIQFATLAGAPSIDAGDFLIV